MATIKEITKNDAEALPQENLNSKMFKLYDESSSDDEPELKVTSHPPISDEQFKEKFNITDEEIEKARLIAEKQDNKPAQKHFGNKRKAPKKVGISPIYSFKKD